MKEEKAPRVPLANGATIPQVGLGVWQTPRGAVTKAAVTSAIAQGYRHVDTARIYGNERDVGEAIRAADAPRAELFVTTKLWNEDQGYDPALRAFDASLERLGLDYVDLYLVHWPVQGKRKDSWRALARLFEEKRARAIGVSNFLVPHLEELLDGASVVPAVNQIELHPFLQHRDTVRLCREKGIVVEAYSPLTRGHHLADPVIARVAKRVGRSPAQVLLRWGIQHDFVVLPKSSNEARIGENIALFDFTLDAASMADLDALEAGHATAWDPRDQA